MNILNTQKVSMISTCTLQIRQFFQIIDIIKETLLLNRSFSFDLFKQLSQIIETLLCHNSIISFVGDLWREGIDQVRKIGPCGVAGTAEALSDNEESICAVLGENGFAAGGKVMD